MGRRRHCRSPDLVGVLESLADPRWAPPGSASQPHTHPGRPSPAGKWQRQWKAAAQCTHRSVSLPSPHTPHRAPGARPCRGYSKVTRGLRAGRLGHTSAPGGQGGPKTSGCSQEKTDAPCPACHRPQVHLAALQALSSLWTATQRQPTLYLLPIGVHTQQGAQGRRFQHWQRGCRRRGQ